MQQISTELLAECRSLAQLCESLTHEQWRLRTDFYGWTPWDEIAHLAFFDETGLQAITSPQGFAAESEELKKKLSRGNEISAITRGRFGHLDGPSLLKLWRERHEALATALAGMEPKARLPWYGPEMSARSFASARLMETWAHGQDIWDVLGRERGPSPGLRSIAHLGVTAYGWTFANRRLPIPQPVPFVDLDGPDGSRWTWGDVSDQDYVRGSALDFALLVTQRRHRGDVQLQWAGEGAEQWTLLAQCFAGPPADGPPPGLRGRRA